MNTKKEKFIFWIIGLGCGIILSGIVGTGISLRMLNNQLIQVNTKVEENRKETNESVDYSSTQLEDLENVEEMALVESTDELANEEIIEIPQETIDIFIPAGTGAGEISYILEEKGIIESADTFVTYIANQNQARSLRQGSFEFPTNIDYDEALEILLRKKR